MMLYAIRAEEHAMRSEDEVTSHALTLQAGWADLVKIQVEIIISVPMSYFEKCKIDF